MRIQLKVVSSIAILAVALSPFYAVRSMNYLYQTAKQQKSDWSLMEKKSDQRTGTVNKFPSSISPIIPSVGRLDGDNWLDLHDKLVDTVKANQAPIDILLVGDSITQQWGSTINNKPLNASWQKHFAKYKTINIGISGDKTENVLWRLDRSGIESLQPRLVILLVGVNNMFAVPDVGSELVAKGIKLCVEKIRKKLPQAEVLVVKILPAYGLESNYYQYIKQTNRDLDRLKLNRDPKVHTLDLWNQMVNRDGSLKKELFLDKVHLSQSAGYGLYANQLQPIVKKLLDK